MLFPISFCIPKEKITIINIDNHKKKKTIATVIPGNKDTYIFSTEKDYYNDYQQSYFGITMKKAGWDCLRHYEIIANGCIPLFIDIYNCPDDILILFPKSLIIESNDLFVNFNIENDQDKYWRLLNKLQDYMLNHLTTTAMAQYVLRSIDKNSINNILFLSGLDDYALAPDYLRCLLLHGFKTIFHQKCHDYPRINHLYTDFPENWANHIYGKGFTYTRLLTPDYHFSNLNETLFSDIENHNYDIIIYGSCHRGLPFYDFISEHYKKNEIILLCGEDAHQCELTHYSDKGHHMFIRENWRI